MNEHDIPNNPESSFPASTVKSKPGWGLTTVTVLLTLLGFLSVFFLVFIRTRSVAEGIGACLAAPILACLVVGIFQIGKSYRNWKSRLKIYCWSLVILLAFGIPGELEKISQKVQQVKELKGIQQRQEEFDQQVSSIDDEEELDALYTTYMDSTQASFERLSEGSTGEDKKFFAILKDFSSETQEKAQEWQEAVNAVQSPQFLNFSLLTSSQEFAYQRQALKTYLEKTTHYSEFFSHTIPRFKQRLSVLGEKNVRAKRALEGATETYRAQKIVVEPLLEAHLHWGNNLLKILDLLEDHNGQWTYQNDKLSFENDTVLAAFKEIAEAIEDNEATIDTLTSKLTEA